MSFEGGLWRRAAPPVEYRWRCGLRAGRWRPTYKDAADAAVSGGLATWEGTGRARQLFLGPLVEIERRTGPAKSTKKAG